jgi:hypothetical protein
MNDERPYQLGEEEGDNRQAHDEARVLVTLSLKLKAKVVLEVGMDCDVEKTFANIPAGKPVILTDQGQNFCESFHLEVQTG